MSSTVHTITIPKHLGTRELSINLTSHLPNDLAGETVIVDALSTEATSQGAVDEICRQIAGDRNASMVLVTTQPNFIRRASESATRRQFIDRLKVVNELP